MSESSLGPTRNIMGSFYKIHSSQRYSCTSTVCEETTENEQSRCLTSADPASVYLAYPGANPGRPPL